MNVLKRLGISGSETMPAGFHTLGMWSNGTQHQGSDVHLRALSPKIGATTRMASSCEVAEACT